MSKEFTSDVEKARLQIEEPLSSTGKRIHPSQIWRDGKLIPSVAPILVTARNGSYQGYPVYVGKAGVVEFYDKAPLARVAGTKNSFYSPFLVNMIPENFDPVTNSYAYKIYTSDSKRIPFGRGKPNIDNAVGVLTFDDEYFIDGLTLSGTCPISMTFYRYVGNTGFFGDDGTYLPFDDTITLLKNKSDPSEQARFMVRGGKNKETKYVLPPSAGTYIGSTDDTTGVVVLEGNINTILNEIGQLDCGKYL
jgi:hypothetical protein